MKPLFSIITVSYNSEKTISHTIQSVLNQTCQDYEYIIIDGDSKDSTVNIIKKYELKFDGRLQWISEKDKGIYDAMNKGIIKAAGKFIWLVNSDDWIEKNAIEILKMHIDDLPNPDDTLICGWMNVINYEGKIVNVSRSNKTMLDIASKKFAMGVCHPATIVPKEIYNSIGLYDNRYYISADIDFILRCVLQKKNFYFINRVLTNMRNTGISNQIPLIKNLHDWKIRYSTYCSSNLEYYYYLYISILKLIVRKIVSKELLLKILDKKNNKLLSQE